MASPAAPWSRGDISDHANLKLAGGSPHSAPDGRRKPEPSLKSAALCLQEVKHWDYTPGKRTKKKKKKSPEPSYCLCVFPSNPITRINAGSVETFLSLGSVFNFLEISALVSRNTAEEMSRRLPKDIQLFRFRRNTSLNVQLFFITG